MQGVCGARMVHATERQNYSAHATERCGKLCSSIIGKLVCLLAHEDNPNSSQAASAGKGSRGWQVGSSCMTHCSNQRERCQRLRTTVGGHVSRGVQHAGLWQGRRTVLRLGAAATVLVGLAMALVASGCSREGCVEGQRSGRGVEATFNTTGGR